MCTNLLYTSLLRAFVNPSAILYIVLTRSRLIFSLKIASLTKNQRISSYLILFLYKRFPIRSQVLMLSVKITIGFTTFGRFNTVAIFISYQVSLTGLLRAYHSATIEDSAIIVYFLKYYLIGVPPKNQIAPSIDFVLGQSLYKASIYIKKVVSQILPSVI